MKKSRWVIFEIPGQPYQFKLTIKKDSKPEIKAYPAGSIFNNAKLN